MSEYYENRGSPCPRNLLWQVNVPSRQRQQAEAGSLNADGEGIFVNSWHAAAAVSLKLLLKMVSF